MCLDNAGMWKRKNERLPADLCLEQATEDERLDFFDEAGKWLRETRENARTAANRAGLQIDDPDLVAWWKVQAHCTGKTSLLHALPL